jgi:hypothetical protein
VGEPPVQALGKRKQCLYFLGQAFPNMLPATPVLPIPLGSPQHHQDFPPTGCPSPWDFSLLPCLQPTPPHGPLVGIAWPYAKAKPVCL